MKDIMSEPRRFKSNTEKAAIKIQKNIDYAAECGKSKVLVFTSDFSLTSSEREAINFNLQKAGYKYLWISCNNEDERIQVCWRDC
jgi:hypothetical protein